MLLRVRSLSRAIAVAVLLPLVLAPLVAAPHAAACHDAECDVAYVEHDESAHKLKRASSEDSGLPSHCAVCHLARSFRTGPEFTQEFAAPPEYRIRVDLPLVGAPLVFPAAQPPLRSPPSVPVLA
jgi:hypothetical protein